MAIPLSRMEEILEMYSRRYGYQLVEDLMRPMEHWGRMMMDSEERNEQRVNMSGIGAAVRMREAEEQEIARVQEALAHQNAAVRRQQEEIGRARVEVRSRNALEGEYRRMRPAPDTRPWAHLKSRDGWTKRIRVDSNTADRLIVPELRRGTARLHDEYLSDSIDSVEYRKVKEVTTRDFRMGTQKVEYWFEEI